MRAHKVLCDQMPARPESPSLGIAVAYDCIRISHPQSREEGIAAMRNKRSQTSLIKASWMLATALIVALPQAAGAETVLRIGMTAADIPRTLGQPDQGFEGNRFTGLTM